MPIDLNDGELRSEIAALREEMAAMRAAADPNAARNAAIAQLSPAELEVAEKFYMTPEEYLASKQGSGPGRGTNPEAKEPPPARPLADGGDLPSSEAESQD